MKISPDLQKIEFQLAAKADQLMNRADFKAARKLMEKAVKKFPDSIDILYNLATATGDDLENTSPNQIQKNYKKAASILKNLIPRIRNRSIEFQISVRNEYFWFSAQPRKQYHLGIEMVSRGWPKAYYCQGVGAIMVCEKYLKEKRFTLGIKWAQKAELAFKEYFLVNKNNYNSYCWYAKSLGYQGRLKEMEIALRKGAKVAHKPISFFEFEDVRKCVQQFNPSALKNIP